MCFREETLSSEVESCLYNKRRKNALGPLIKLCLGSRVGVRGWRVP